MTARALTLFAFLASTACGDALPLGNDLVWFAEHERAELDEWTADDRGGTRIDTPDTAEVTLTDEEARSGTHALKLVDVDATDEGGVETYRDFSELGDAYYSAWFQVAEPTEGLTLLTILRVQARTSEDEPFVAREVQLRADAEGSYVVTLFSPNRDRLRAPVPDPPPRVEPQRWFHVEVRYRAAPDGLVRVWVDGRLAYDLRESSGDARGPIFGVGAWATSGGEGPFVVYVDDAAASLSRVTPGGGFR